MRATPYATGVAMVALAGALWSLNSTVIKLIAAMDTWQIMLWRSLGMLPVLALVLLWRRGRLLRGTGPAGLIGAIGLTGAFAGAIAALTALPVATAVFLFSAAPFLTAILGRIVLGERVRPVTWAAILLAGTGIWVMVGGSGLSGGSLTGHLAALGSALGFAVFSVALRAGRGTETLSTTLLGALLSMAVAALVLLWRGTPLVAGPADTALALGMGAFLLALGMILFTQGSRIVPASELVLLSQVEIILAPVWAWALLAETPAPATLQGGALILGAVLLNALSGMRAPAAPPQRA